MNIINTYFVEKTCKIKAKKEKITFNMKVLYLKQIQRKNEAHPC